MDKHMNSLVGKGSPVSDTRAFRRSLGQFVTGVTVITTDVDGIRAGVTANSFSSLSLDPPLVLWSIARTSRSFEIFQKADHFVINILASDQIAISQQFASAAEDKFEGVGWEVGETGSPLLEGVIGYLECRREAHYPGGDHILLVGRVESYAHFSGEPLLFAQGRYAVARDHPALAPAASSGALSSAPPDTARLSALVYNAHHAASMAFAAQRREEGLSFPQGMAMFALSQVQTLSSGELAEKLLLPAQIVADECRDLIERGLVVRDMEERLSLTDAGRAVREAVNRRAARFEAEQLEGFSPEAITAARNFLETFSRRVGSAQHIGS